MKNALLKICIVIIFYHGIFACFTKDKMRIGRRALSEKYSASNRRSYNENRRIATRQNPAERTRAARADYSGRTRNAKGVRGVRNTTENAVRPSATKAARPSAAKVARPSVTKVVRPSTASERSKRATARRKRKNAIIKYAMIAVAVFIAVSILLCLPVFNIKSVNVSGNTMLDTYALNSQLDYLNGMNAFTSNKGSLIQKYLFNFEALENELMANNGRIAKVDVKYSLGGELKVIIEEAKPIAVAEIDEKYYLLDRDWVVMEEYSDNPMNAPQETESKKTSKKKNKKKQSDDILQVEEQSQATTVYEETKDLVIVKGLSREDLCVSRVNKEKTGLKSSLLEAAWSFTELSNSPLAQDANKIRELEVDNLFVNYGLERGIKVKMGGFSNFNEEQIMYKAQFLEGILNELPGDSRGTIDMFSSEKPVFIPENK